MTLDLEALTQELEAAPDKNVGGHSCSVQVLVAAHPEAETVIRNAIMDVRRSAARTAEILTRNGLKIGETAINKHRRGACSVCKEG